MKTCCRSLLSALAFTLLIISSYAIRVPRDPNPAPNQVNNDEKITTSAIIGCKDNEDCASTSSGNYKKLMKSSPSSAPPTTIPKVQRLENEKAAMKSETVAPATSQETEYGEITEMDYSPAKRKPPIHN